MRNEQISTTINISRRSELLKSIGDYNFELEVEWRIQSVKPNSLKTGSRNLDQPIFKLQ